MLEFRVWAPRAAAVELLLPGSTQPMVAVGGGWWRAAAEHAGAGTRYAFSLDGGPPRPDPRSCCQPDGDDGWSEVVDHAAFAWTDHSWRGPPLPGAVLYELHVGTFTPEGTFDGVGTKLDHLVELGVDAIELMPVVEGSGGRGWGYDGADLFAPHHAYGGPEGLRRLVDRCHSAGLGVVLDVVYNHLGPAGNYLGEFGPYFSDRHTTAWGDAVNLDGPGSDEVRRFVIDNALHWFEHYHVDGLRLDAVHALVDDSALHILEELVGEVRALAAHVGRPLFLVAESDRNDPREVRSREAGGYGLDAVWADEWHHALHAVLTGERSGYYQDYGSLTLLGKALGHAWVHDGEWSAHRGRRHGRAPTELPGDRFIVATQNHDQVGNRAKGERLAALSGLSELRIAAALLLTAPFTPLLFQGEEWAATTPFQYFTDHADASLGDAVREGRRAEFAHFGWDPEDIPDPQDPETFERSRLCWAEAEVSPQREILTWYRDLIALRRRLACLSDPRLEHTQVVVDEARRTIAVRRGPVEVLVNLSPVEARRFEAPGCRLLLASEPVVRLEPGAVVVPPVAVAIVEVANVEAG